jgi:hypothetical protein
MTFNPNDPPCEQLLQSEERVASLMEDSKPGLERLNEDELKLVRLLMGLMYTYGRLDACQKICDIHDLNKLMAGQV